MWGDFKLPPRGDENCFILGYYLEDGTDTFSRNVGK